jgi:hypothetical protein
VSIGDDTDYDRQVLGYSILTSQIDQLPFIFSTNLPMLTTARPTVP